MAIFLFLLEHIYVMWKEHKNGNMSTDILTANLRGGRNNDKKSKLLHYGDKLFHFLNNQSYYGSHIPR